MLVRSEIKKPHPLSQRTRKKDGAPGRGIAFFLLRLSYREGKDAYVLRAEHQGVLASWQRLLRLNQPDQVLRLGHVDGEQVALVGVGDLAAAHHGKDAHASAIQFTKFLLR